MSEFPSNSQKKKPPTPKETPAPEEKKVIEKVVKTDAIQRKKPLGTRMKDLFFGGDSAGAWDYVQNDVLIPAAKNAMADAISQGFERMIFGEAQSRSRRTGRRPNEPHISYNSMYDRGSSKRPQLSRRARASHDFDEIILRTRPEAEEVLDRLFELMSKYELATVADLYAMVGVKADYTDEKWGWLDLRGAEIVRVRAGYLLDLPRPEPID